MFLTKISPVTTMSPPINMNGFVEPLDYSASPILDLCVRQKNPPSPNQQPNTPIENNMFTATESDFSSEEGSIVCETMFDIKTHPTSIFKTINNAPPKPTTRPFKAYPKDPFVFSIGTSAFDSKESAEAYAEFRQNMLNQVRGGTGNVSPTGVCNPKMRRSSVTSSQSGQEQNGRDASYWEKRRKNNEAAKRSRDARRAKEDEIAIRAAFLEQENLKLKYQLATLKNETAKLRCLLYN